MITLEPPGNVARDVALYRRKLFSDLGEGSALAFPEVVNLAFSPHLDAPKVKNAFLSTLATCWAGIGGAFSSEGPRISEGLLYLAISGPIAQLAARVAEALEESGLPQEIGPVGTGIGFFLCRPPDPEIALRTALRIGYPRVHFLDGSLLLLGLRFGADPFRAATWRELARARRHTGRPTPHAVGD